MTTIPEQLHANGYEPIQLAAHHHAGGTERTWGCVGWSPLLNSDGSLRYGERRSLATLEFQYATARHLSGFSRAARRFSNALVELLTAGEPCPLVWRTPVSLHFVYRIDSVQFLGLEPPYKHGLTARDERSTLSLRLVTDTVPVGDVADWREGLSPLNTPRSSLPLWNSPEMSGAVHGLVERYVAQGDLRIAEPYLATA